MLSSVHVQPKICDRTTCTHSKGADCHDPDNKMDACFEERFCQDIPHYPHLTIHFHRGTIKSKSPLSICSSIISTTVHPINFTHAGCIAEGPRKCSRVWSCLDERFSRKLHAAILEVKLWPVPDRQVFNEHCTSLYTLSLKEYKTSAHNQANHYLALLSSGSHSYSLVCVAGECTHMPDQRGPSIIVCMEPRACPRMQKVCPRL